MLFSQFGLIPVFNYKIFELTFHVKQEFIMDVFVFERFVGRRRKVYFTTFPCQFHGRGITEYRYGPGRRINTNTVKIIYYEFVGFNDVLSN